MIELSPRFNFNEVDAKWSRYWVDNNLFHARVNPDKKPYTVVIPPPNVTGILHMGHALNNTLQDIMIRYKRMRGFEALWMPGTDHAGIATQNVVERQLSKEGKTRHDLSREEFLERLWAWKREYGDTIIHQLKKLGASCDWPRARFTMDEDYSRAVRSVFIRLYANGLIYQGEYIINWCPRCQTALSDEEAEHKELQGNLYHIRYPLKDAAGEFMTVATTRPETMLGDTAVAVNPKDRRYKKYIGQTLVLPLLNREIKVIADGLVDSKFGTGAVKVTPAHDPNDFEMGRRHHLEFINIMRPDGILNQQAGKFNGMDRFKAREAVIESLEQLKLLAKIEPHTHAVGHCYRCHTVVEPYLSKQWFVRMQPLAKPAIDAVRDGRIKFYPSRWTKVYLNWMENIRDWCISRQIWWGHRIPVWYCAGDGSCTLACREPIVAETPPQKCPHCGSTNLRQDEDVLDTWFSSWLWPFATFGWPPPAGAAGGGPDSGQKDLDYFYPTASLFTAPEIIFFWVARMIMAGMEFMGDIPFSDVYIHGTVRDAKGRKMSKSLGNALDPLEIIREYGADALRFSLISNSGQDLFISREKFETGRNFANKLWNASRLVLMRVQDPDSGFDLGKLNTKELDLPSRWIISRFYATLEKVGAAIERYRFSEAESLIYEFFWGNFCDWYLELIKDRWSEPAIQRIALAILRGTLKMVHPFMPFVTEELWEKTGKAEGPLCRQDWPAASKRSIDKSAEKDMQTLIALAGAIRNVRSQWNINPAEQIECRLITSSSRDRSLLETNAAVLRQAARLGTLTLMAGRNSAKIKTAATALVGNIKCVIPLGGVIDVEKEKKKILDHVQEQEKALDGLARRLKNKEFLKKAPAEIVAKEKERLTSLNARVAELKRGIAGLE